jgi:hypothetical protein
MQNNFLLTLAVAVLSSCIYVIKNLILMLDFVVPVMFDSWMAQLSCEVPMTSTFGLAILATKTKHRFFFQLLTFFFQSR